VTGKLATAALANGRATSGSSVYDSSMGPRNVGRLYQWALEYGVKPVALASGSVLAALLCTFPLQHVIAYPFVFLFFAAIIGSAWFGGFVAGLVSVGLSSIVIAYFFIPPLLSMSVAKESRSFFAAYILCAIAISIVSAARKRAENAIRNARDELEVKVHERTAELERSNLEIRESERQLRMLTETIPQQIWRADAAGCIEYCNQHLGDYIGHSGNSLRGAAFFNILHPEDLPLFRQGWEAALLAGERFEAEARVLGEGGNYRWFLIRSIPQRSNNGQIARWYGIHIDIEERHRAQQKLVLAQDELMRLSRNLSIAETAASIAHELNQPMTAVVTQAFACLGWLQRDPANLEKAAATAEKIVHESARASAVVKRVRALYQTESPVREPADMNRLIQELSRLLRDEAIRQGVSIRLALARDLPRLEMDSVQIQQVLLNLAVNGMDAMTQNSSPRELTIRSEKLNELELFVTVRDTGRGIPLDIVDRIFEPFFSTKRQGMGMGLAICRNIIESHNGRLWATNSPDGGAILQFTVRAQS
jgi:PAS domain S-box-containing protein